MLRIARAGAMLAAFACCVLAAPSNAAGDLITELETWLDAHAGYPPREAVPTVHIVSETEAIMLNGLAGRGHGRNRGLYDADIETIYLVRPWNAANPEDVSVLLHELFHHRQVGHHFVCPAAQEAAAYRLQDAWLSERGLRANVNWFAISMEAACIARDKHP